MTKIDRIGKYLQPGRSWFTRNVNTIKVFSIHHDAIPHDNRSADEILNQIYNTHKDKGWPGASYHYYIHRDGTVYQLNKHEWVTWIDGVNWDAIGIVLNGYFHPDFNNKPTTAQLVALKELLDELSTQHPEFPAGKDDVYGHRERSATACPGDNFFPYVKEYREKNGNVNWGGSTPTPEPTPQPITSNTKIPANLLNSENYPVTEDLEVQVIKSRLSDLSRDLKNANNKIAGAKQILS